MQTSPILTSVFDGHDVCIFSYGQAGTGKVFTLEGTLENRGVIDRTFQELFRIANERSNNDMRYELFVSILEVYNEKTRDLLVQNSNPTRKYIFSASEIFILFFFFLLNKQSCVAFSSGISCLLSTSFSVEATTGKEEKRSSIIVLYVFLCILRKCKNETTIGF